MSNTSSCSSIVKSLRDDVDYLFSTSSRHESVNLRPIEKRLSKIEKYLDKLSLAGFDDTSLTAFISNVKLRQSIRSTLQQLTTHLEDKYVSLRQDPYTYHPMKVWRLTNRSFHLIKPFLYSLSRQAKAAVRQRKERFQNSNFTELHDLSFLGPVDIHATTIVLPFSKNSKYKIGSKTLSISHDLQIIYGDDAYQYFNKPIPGAPDYLSLNLVLYIDHVVGMVYFYLPRFYDRKRSLLFEFEVHPFDVSLSDIFTWLINSSSEISTTHYEFSDISAPLLELALFAILPPLGDYLVESLKSVSYEESSLKDGMGLASLSLVLDLAKDTPQIKSSQYDFPYHIVLDYVTPLTQCSHYVLGATTLDPFQIGCKILHSYTDPSGELFSGVSNVDHPHLSKTLFPFLGEQGIVYSDDGSYPKLPITVQYTHGNSISAFLEYRIVTPSLSNEISFDSSLEGFYLPSVYWNFYGDATDSRKINYKILGGGFSAPIGFTSPTGKMNSVYSVTFPKGRLEFRITIKNEHALQPGEALRLPVTIAADEKNHELTVELLPMILDGISHYRSTWQDVDALTGYTHEITTQFDWKYDFLWEASLDGTVPDSLPFDPMYIQRFGNISEDYLQLKPRSADEKFYTYRSRYIHNKVEVAARSVLKHSMGELGSILPAVTKGRNMYIYDDFIDRNYKFAVDKRYITPSKLVTTTLNNMPDVRYSIPFDSHDKPPNSKIQFYTDDEVRTDETLLRLYWNRILCPNFHEFIEAIKTEMDKYPKPKFRTRIKVPFYIIVTGETLKTKELILPDLFLAKTDVSVMDRNYNYGLMAAFFAINNLQIRLDHVEEALDLMQKNIQSIWDEIGRINKNIEKLQEVVQEIVKAMQPPPFSITGFFATLFNAIGGIVSAFFPLVGTLITLAGTFITAAEQFMSGDIIGGVLSTLVGGSMGGLGLYKFGKRLLNRTQRSSRLGVAPLKYKQKVIDQVKEYRNPRGAKMIDGDARGAFVDIPYHSDGINSTRPRSYPPTYQDAMNASSHMDLPPPYHSVLDMSWTTGDSFARKSSNQIRDEGTFRMYCQNLSSMNKYALRQPNLVGFEFVVTQVFDPDIKQELDWNLSKTYTFINGENRIQLPCDDELYERATLITKAYSKLEYQTFIHEPELTRLFCEEHPNRFITMNEACEMSRAFSGIDPNLKIIDTLVAGITAEPM